MKEIRETGVTYYIIPKEYSGPFKSVYREFVKLDTVFINDIVIMYDWSNGLTMIEDKETLDGHDVQPMPAFILLNLLKDDETIEWMHRGDKLYA